MSTPKRLESYPGLFFDVAEFIEKNHEAFVIETDSEAEALDLRQTFYGFKSALRREGMHGEYTRFMASQVKVQGATLSVLCRDDTGYAKAIQRALNKYAAKKEE